MPVISIVFDILAKFICFADAFCLYITVEPQQAFSAFRLAFQLYLLITHEKHCTLRTFFHTPQRVPHPTPVEWGTLASLLSYVPVLHVINPHKLVFQLDDCVQVRLSAHNQFRRHQFLIDLSVRACIHIGVRKMI